MKINKNKVNKEKEIAIKVGMRKEFTSKPISYYMGSCCRFENI